MSRYCVGLSPGLFLEICSCLCSGPAQLGKRSESKHGHDNRIGLLDALYLPTSQPSYFMIITRSVENVGSQNGTHPSSCLVVVNVHL